MELHCKDHVLLLNRTLVMGILNVTPDSFADGGKYLAVEKAVARAKQMIAEGADIIDVGGESTRPGSDAVPESEELARVIPVIENIASLAPVSIDTRKPAIADAALQAGACMINDISGCSQEMAKVAKKHNVPVVVMHMQGEPKTMQNNPRYDDVIREIVGFFLDKIDAYSDVQLILDPGIGFGKNLEHNLLILNRLNAFTSIGRPVLVGTSRKSFIDMIKKTPVDKRLPGTIAAHTAAILKGASIIRVHDVAEAKQAAAVADAIKHG